MVDKRNFKTAEDAWTALTAKARRPTFRESITDLSTQTFFENAQTLLSTKQSGPKRDFFFKLLSIRKECLLLFLATLGPSVAERTSRQVLDQLLLRFSQLQRDDELVAIFSNVQFDVVISPQERLHGLSSIMEGVQNGSGEFLRLLDCLTAQRPIDVSVLEAATQERTRWAEDGSEENFTIREFPFLRPEILSILLIFPHLGETLRFFKSLGLITYDTKVSVLQHLPQNCDRKRDARLFISYLFTGTHFFHRQIAPLALPHLRHLTHWGKQEVDERSRPFVVEALLNASKFSTREWKSLAVETAWNLGLDRLQPHMRAYAFLRRSVILRAIGSYQESEKVIKAYFKETRPEPVNSRLNAMFGLLTASLIWTSLAQWQFQKALEISNTWQRSVHDSLLEVRVRRRMVIARGAALLHNGHYSSASEHFLNAISLHRDLRAVQYAIINQISVLCDANMITEARQTISDVLSFMGFAPEKMQREHLQDHCIRSFYLCFAEVLVRERAYSDAQQALRLLRDYFGHEGSETDRERQIQVHVLHAQNQHHAALHSEWQGNKWFEICFSWKIAKKMAKKRDQTSWDYGLINISLHHAQTILGVVGPDEQYLRTATAIFEHDGDFWRPRSSTRWLENLLCHPSGLPVNLLERCINRVKERTNVENVRSTLRDLDFASIPPM